MAGAYPPSTESVGGPSFRSLESESRPLGARGNSAARETQLGAFPASSVGRSPSLVAGLGMTSQRGAENYISKREGLGEVTLTGEITKAVGV